MLQWMSFEQYDFQPNSAVSRFLFTISRTPQRSALFPYTTLFRSPRSNSRPNQDQSRAGLPDKLAGPLLRWRERGSPSPAYPARPARSEEHTSELQSHSELVCRLLLEKKKFRMTGSSGPRCCNGCLSSSTTSSRTARCLVSCLQSRGHRSALPSFLTRRSSDLHDQILAQTKINRVPDCQIN